jgi:hypothetical protein
LKTLESKLIKVRIVELNEDIVARWHSYEREGAVDIQFEKGNKGVRVRSDPN